MNICKTIFFGEILIQKEILLQLLLLGIGSAIFSALASAWKETQVSRNVWYVVYSMLTGILLRGFLVCMEYASHCLEQIFAFMRLLVPAFAMALSYICGAYTISIYYQITFLMITGIDWVFLTIVFPLIRIYICLDLINLLLEEDYLSGFLELIRIILEWIRKTVGAAAIGLQVIQGLIIPAAGQYGTQLFQRILEAVPGVGNGIRSVSEVLFGTGILVKNGIGAAGCLILVLLSAVPLIQMGATVLLYYAAGATLQPISDSKIKRGMSEAAYAIQLLMRFLAIAVFLFVISVALICIFTNQIL